MARIVLLSMGNLPVYYLLNWIVTAGVQWIATQDSLYAQEGTFYRSVQLNSINGIFRA
jgi:hypothetical protein